MRVLLTLAVLWTVGCRTPTAPSSDEVSRSKTQPVPVTERQDPTPLR